MSPTTKKSRTKMLRRTVWILCGFLLVGIFVMLIVTSVQNSGQTGRALFYRQTPSLYKYDYITTRHSHLINGEKVKEEENKNKFETLAFDHNLSIEQFAYIDKYHKCLESHIFEHDDSIYKLLYFLINFSSDVRLRTHAYKLPICLYTLSTREKFDVKVSQKSNILTFEIDANYRSYLVQKILYKMSNNKYANIKKVKKWLLETKWLTHSENNGIEKKYIADKWVGLTHLQRTEKVNVGVCIVATRKYKNYVRSTINSLLLHFYRNQNVVFYLFTDNSSEFRGLENTVLFDIPAYGFPEATLYRYRFMKKAIKSFRQKNIHFVYYIDADYRFNKRPTNLPQSRDVQGIFATKHIRNLTESFDDSHRIGSFETNEKSQAYIGPDTSMDAYYCGGFNGGSREAWINAITEMDKMIQIDESNNVMPIWHDESIFNKYCTIHKPTWVFDQSFMYTEKCFLRDSQNDSTCQALRSFSPIASPLEKDHVKIRMQ